AEIISPEDRERLQNLTEEELEAYVKEHPELVASSSSLPLDEVDCLQIFWAALLHEDRSLTFEQAVELACSLGDSYADQWRALLEISMKLFQGLFLKPEETGNSQAAAPVAAASTTPSSGA